MRLKIPERKSSLKDGDPILLRTLPLGSGVGVTNVETVHFDPPTLNFVRNQELNRSNSLDRSNYNRSQSFHTRIVPNRVLGRSDAHIETNHCIVSGYLNAIYVLAKAQDWMGVRRRAKRLAWHEPAR